MSDATADPTAAVRHAVPHRVIPQLLRPLVAAPLPPGSIVLREFLDLQACVTEATFADDLNLEQYLLAWRLPHLTTVDLSDCKCGGAQILEPIRHVANTLTSLDLTEWCLPPEMATFLVPLRNLTSLTLVRVQNFDEDSALILTNALPRLEVLNVCRTVKTAALLAALTSKLHSLRSLDVSQCDIAPVSGLMTLLKLGMTNMSAGLDISALRQHPSLTELRFDGTSPLTEDVGKVLRSIPGLRTLSVGDCRIVDPAFLLQLARFTSLVELRVGQWQSLCATSFEAAMRGLGRLESLFVDRVDLREACLKAIGYLPALKKLTFDYMSDNTLMDVGAIVGSGTNLTELNFLTCTLAAESLVHIGRCKQLTCLTIARCKARPSNIHECFKSLPLLRTLSLVGMAKLDNAALRAICDLKHLRSLNLSGALLISDEGIEQLPRLSRLTELDLSGCSGVTGAGLRAIGRLRLLHRLDIMWCENVSESDLDPVRFVPYLNTTCTSDTGFD